MNNHMTMKSAIPLVLLLLLLSVSYGMAQGEKIKSRLSVDYYKIMNDERFLEANVKFRGDDGYEPATNLSLNVYRLLSEDSLALVDDMLTNENGVARLYFENTQIEPNDTTAVNEYVVKIEDNDKFLDAKRAISFVDANLSAEIEEIDSIYHVVAHLTTMNGDPIAEERLKLRLQRLFAPLTIGKSYYETDEEGTILVPIEDPLPGINGILTFEVILESDDYGIVSNVFDAPIGKVIVDESSYDQRTIWSPPSKTPIFLWIFANVLILGAWLVIAILTVNLFRIFKA